MQAAYDVAIIGAGPTGLTLANILGGKGLRVVLIERNRGTVQEPRSVSVDDESLRTMQAIGLLDEVMADVAADYGSHYFSSSGLCFARVEPVSREYGFPKRNAFTQPKLEQTLLKGTQRFPSVTVLFRHELETIEESAGEVTLHVRDHTGQLQVVRATYMAGCDGASSLVRKQIGARMMGFSYPQRWLIVDLASTKERLRQTRVVCNPERPLITLPGPHGIRRYEFMLQDGEEEASATDPAFVRQLLAANGPDADAPVVRAQMYTFHSLIADKWNTRRVFLAGDAAHLSPPFAGQGMNSGLRDAFNLGWKLAAIVQGEIGPHGLSSYFEERAPHARQLIKMSENMGRVMMPKSRLQAFLVQRAFRLTRFAPRIQAYFAQMKYKPKPIYRRGLLDATEEPGLVGRMLPQPVVEERDCRTTLLDNRLGSCWGLIAYGPEAQPLLEKANQLDLGLRDVRAVAILPSTHNPYPDVVQEIDSVRDLHGTMKTLIEEGRTVVMVIRPDRYIAAASSDPSVKRLADRMRSLIARAEMEPAEG